MKTVKKIRERLEEVEKDLNTLEGWRKSPEFYWSNKYPMENLRHFLVRDLLRLQLKQFRR